MSKSKQQGKKHSENPPFMKRTRGAYVQVKKPNQQSYIHGAPDQDSDDEEESYFASIGWWDGLSFVYVDLPSGGDAVTLLGRIFELEDTEHFPDRQTNVIVRFERKDDKDIARSAEVHCRTAYEAGQVVQLLRRRDAFCESE